MEPPRPPFAQWLDEQMTARKLKQIDVSRMTGVDPVQVMRWRRGDTRPGMVYLEKLAAAFGVERAVLERLAYGSAITPDSTQAAESAALDAATQAELESYRQWYDTLIRNKVPRGMWRAYTEACDQLAESFSSVGQQALSSLPPEKRDGPDGEPWKPLTLLDLDPLCQLAA